MNEYEVQYQKFVSFFVDSLITKSKEIWVDKIDPHKILNSIDEEEVDSEFWGQHGETLERYKELIVNYNRAQIIISFEHSLDSLPYSDPRILAHQVFHGDPIRIFEYDGILMIEGNGRHRIAAAKLLKKEGIDVILSGFVTRYVSVTKEIKKNHSQLNLNNKMANYQIEGQVELLRDAKSLFSQHAEKVQELMDQFNSGVRALEQEELNHDYMDFLEEFLADYIVKMRTIRETIEDEYLPQLDRKIRSLEERE